MYGALRGGGAVVYANLAGTPRQFPTTTVEAAAQLAAEVADTGADHDVASLVRLLAREHTGLQEARAGARAVYLWAIRGQIYGIPGAQDLKRRAILLRRHYRQLAWALHTEIVGIVTEEDDPNLIIETILKPAQLPVSGLEAQRSGLLPGPQLAEHSREGVLGSELTRRLERPLCIIGADPGWTTGLALIAEREILGTAALHRLEDVLSTILGWNSHVQADGRKIATIGLEKFGNLQFLDKSRAHSLHAEGVVRLAAQMIRARVEEHTPAMIDILVRQNCARLREELGAELPGTPHERDALAHAVLTLQGRNRTRGPK